MKHTLALLTALLLLGLPAMVSAADMGVSAVAQPWKPQWKPDASSPFEVGTQLRPWEIVV